MKLLKAMFMWIVGIFIQILMVFSLPAALYMMMHTGCVVEPNASYTLFELGKMEFKYECPIKEVAPNAQGSFDFPWEIHPDSQGLDNPGKSYEGGRQGIGEEFHF